MVSLWVGSAGGTASAEQASELDEETYICSACASRWPYPTVRNTGRCPACGEGLLRGEEHGQ